MKLQLKSSGHVIEVAKKDYETFGNAQKSAYNILNKEDAPTAPAQVAKDITKKNIPEKTK